MSAPRSNRVEVNGWVVLDKPVGMTSTQGVAVVKRVFNAKKAGHAGTLDPLASGILPIDLGETVIADDVSTEELLAALAFCGIEAP